MVQKISKSQGMGDGKKQRIAAHFDTMAAVRDDWKRKNRYYHATLEQLCASFIPPGKSVLEIGCGTGDLLAAANPGRGIGIDLSPAMVQVAAQKYPQYTFLVGDAERLELSERFDYVIMSDLIGHLEDIWQALREVHKVAHSETRLVITFYNFVWEAILRLGEKVGWKMPQGYQNWLGMQDIRNLLYLTDFQVEQEGVCLLVPKRIPLISDWVNRNLANSPLFRWACLVQYFVARPVTPMGEKDKLTCSVIIPCRNEVENIEDCIGRIREFGKHTEIIFVDGASTDGTQAKIKAMIERYRGQKDIKLIHQVEETTESIEANCSDKVKMLPMGKGDAVRKGFEVATGDVLMVLDADLTVPPEDLPKFYAPIAEKKAEFVNGTRLVYPLENEAMQMINYFGNKFFSIVFTWLLGQPVKDTLCGTKVLFSRDYKRIKADRAYFGDFDPFGDFDLLFGAARLGLKIVEMPVRYRRRVAGYTKVRVFKHGWLLMKMSLIAFRKFKLDQWVRRRRVALKNNP